MGDTGKAQRARDRMLQTYRTYTLRRCVSVTARDFQMLVRLAAARPKTGEVECYTCDHVGHYKEMHGGHFVSRRHLATVYDFRNCHPQCIRCNRFLNGNLDVYRTRLVQSIGLEQVEELERKKAEVVRYTKEQLVDLRIEFKQGIKEMLEVKGL